MLFTIVWYVDYSCKVWWFVCIFLVAALLGSVPFKAAKSCQHIIQSGDSTGNGEYWVDPQGTGNSFKAFCDMTTDGGTSVFFLFFVFKCWVFFFVVYITRLFFIDRRLDDGVERYFAKPPIFKVEWHSWTNVSRYA